MMRKKRWKSKTYTIEINSIIHSSRVRIDTEVTPFCARMMKKLILSLYTFSQHKINHISCFIFCLSYYKILICHAGMSVRRKRLFGFKCLSMVHFKQILHKFLTFLMNIWFYLSIQYHSFKHFTIFFNVNTINCSYDYFTNENLSKGIFFMSINF